MKMKFHLFRCIGIIAFGIAAFLLAIIQETYHGNLFFNLLRDHVDLLYGFIISLIIAAIFLSIEQEKKE